MQAASCNRYYVGRLVNGTLVPTGGTALSSGSWGHTIAKSARGRGRQLLWGSVLLDLTAIPNYALRTTMHSMVSDPPPPSRAVPCETHRRRGEGTSE